MTAPSASDDVYAELQALREQLAKIADAVATLAEVVDEEIGNLRARMAEFDA